MLSVLILYISGGNLQFKVDSERQIFENLFMTVLIYSQSFCQKYAERKSPKIYFVLMSGLGWNPGFSSNKPLIGRVLLDYGDFMLGLYLFKNV